MDSAIVSVRYRMFQEEDERVVSTSTGNRDLHWAHGGGCICDGVTAQKDLQNTRLTPS